MKLESSLGSSADCIPGRIIMHPWPSWFGSCMSVGSSSGSARGQKWPKPEVV